MWTGQCDRRGGRQVKKGEAGDVSQRKRRWREDRWAEKASGIPRTGRGACGLAGRRLRVSQRRSLGVKLGHRLPRLGLYPPPPLVPPTRRAARRRRQIER